jgi:hypothetical protein
VWIWENGKINNKQIYVVCYVVSCVYSTYASEKVLYIVGGLSFFVSVLSFINQSKVTIATGRALGQRVGTGTYIRIRMITEGISLG